MDTRPVESVSYGPPETRKSNKTWFEKLKRAQCNQQYAIPDVVIDWIAIIQ